jgi:hypothetical protein
VCSGAWEDSYLQGTYTPADHCGFDGFVCLHTLPGSARPSTQKRNDVGADMILAKEFKRLIRRRHAFVNEGINSCLACCHAKCLSVHQGFDASA